MKLKNKTIMRSILSILFTVAVVFGVVPLPFVSKTAVVKADANIVELTSETGEIILTDGQILSGIGGNNTHVIIEDGATITLSDVDIFTNISNNGNHKWAGITCAGNATIILAEGTSNAVKGGYDEYSGIYIPQNKTLVIKGNGTLKASCGIGSFQEGYAAGIGACYDDACGNIVIESGSITAEGGNSGTGIGGYLERSCGEIIIKDDVTYLNAKKGSNARYSIGSGSSKKSNKKGVCDKVSVLGVETGSITGNYTYDPSVHYTVQFDGNGGNGNMNALSLLLGEPVFLPQSAFTKVNSVFVGWSKTADGEIDYKAGSIIGDISPENGDTVVLYAIWRDLIETITAETGALRLENGQTLSGTGGEDTHVTIGDGATVTFRNVNITKIKDVSGSLRWAGINCEGDATIILADNTTNVVKGSRGFPGIYVPVNKTLTIQGNGSLESAATKNAAGIGASQNDGCGNIIIKSGNIIVTGNGEGAGIGGFSENSCGNITIAKEVTYLKAIKGDSSKNSIGIGYTGDCGKVSICSFETGMITDDYIYDPSKHYSVYFNNNGGTGSMSGFSLAIGEPIKLAKSTLKKTGTIFGGWNTDARSDILYDDEDVIMDLATTNGATVTLYAIWKDPTETITTETGTIKVVDGQVLTGIGGENTHLSIADGAKVTLSGLIITDITNDDSHRWAGITCEGDATIILKSGTTNEIRGGKSIFPGIYVVKDKTLVIEGDGVLNVSSNGNAPGIGANGLFNNKCGNIVIKGGKITAMGGDYSPGIGPAQGAKSTCGNITIEGGEITSTGGFCAAGIGAGGDNTSCGDILITGGIVTSTGGQKGAGIGSGIGGQYGSTCGNIMIYGGTLNAIGGIRGAGIGTGKGNSSSNKTSFCGDITITCGAINVTKGEYADHSIGTGQDGTCGTVTIGGVVGEIGESPYKRTISSETYTVRFDANGGKGTMNPFNINRGLDCPLTQNCFTRDGYGFIGWSESSDGDVKYQDCDRVQDLADVDDTITLYAKWRKLLSNTDIIVEGIEESYAYTGNAIKPSVVVYDVKKDITDQCVISFSGNIAIGRASVSIEAKSSSTEYEGSIARSFEICHEHTFSYSAKDATITATCIGEGDCGLEDRKVSLVIQKTPETIYGETEGISATLGGDDEFNVATGLNIGTSNIKYVGKDDTIYAESNVTPKKAGTYSASITIGGKTASVDYSIVPKVVSIDGITVKSKTYDGTKNANIAGTLIVSGKLENDDVYVEVGKALYENEKIGENKVVSFTGWSLAGEDVDNYKLDKQPSDLIADIIARDITITADDQTVEVEGNIDSDKSKYSVTKGILVDGHTIDGIKLAASDTSIVTDNATILVRDAKIMSGDTDVTSNYNISYVDGRLIVTKRKGKILTEPKVATGLTYIGEELKLILSEGTTTTGNMMYAVNTTEEEPDASLYTTSLPTAKKAGNYYVWYMGKGNDYYENTKAYRLQVSIKQAIPEFVAPTTKNLNYSGQLQELVNPGSIKGGTIYYALGDESGNAGTYSDDIPMAKDCGVYKVFYKVVGDENHSNIEENTINVTIDAAWSFDEDSKTLTISGKGPMASSVEDRGLDSVRSDIEKIKIENGVTYISANAFNGCENLKEISIPSDVDFGEHPFVGTSLNEISYRGTVTDWENKAVNPSIFHSVDGCVVSCQGEDGKEDDLFFNVSLNKCVIENISDHVYTGEEIKPKLSISFSGHSLVEGVDYTIEYVSNKNAGTAIVIITGTKEANDIYGVDGILEKSFVISRKELEINAETKSKKYGDSDPLLTFTHYGLVDGDEITGALAREKGEDIGDYSITQGTLTAGANYSISYTGADLTIEKSENISNSPDTVMNVEYTYDKISKVMLPENWDWSELDKDKSLEVATTLTVIALYVGSDKNNYTDDSRSVSIAVTRSACEHKSLTSTEAREQTCEVAGCNAYWTCDICGKYFSDENASTEVEENSWVVNALGHDFDYKNATYAWSEDGKTCTATAICSNDSTHKVVETVTYEEGKEDSKIKATVKEDSTAVKNGTTTYMATFTNEFFEAVSKDVEDIPVKKESKTKPDTNPNPAPEPAPAEKEQPTPDSTIVEPAKDETPDTSKENTNVKEEGTIIKLTGTKATVVVTSSDEEDPTVEYTGTTNNKATSVTIPATVKVEGVTYKVTEVSDKAFEGNKKIKTVTLGKNIEKVGEKAFSGCTSLKTVKIPATVTEIGKNAFKGCMKLTTIKIEAPKKKAKDKSKDKSKDEEEITLTIDNYAFANCPNLKTIELPENVGKLGNYLFKGDSSLTTIIIKTTKLTKKNVGKKAFTGVGKKVVFMVPKNKLKDYTTLFRKKGLSKKVKIKKIK